MHGTQMHVILALTIANLVNGMVVFEHPCCCALCVFLGS